MVTMIMIVGAPRHCVLLQQGEWVARRRRGHTNKKQVHSGNVYTRQGLLLKVKMRAVRLMEECPFSAMVVVVTGEESAAVMVVVAPREIMRGMGVVVTSLVRPHMVDVLKV